MLAEAGAKFKISPELKLGWSDSSFEAASRSELNIHHYLPVISDEPSEIWDEKPSFWGIISSMSFRSFLPPFVGPISRLWNRDEATKTIRFEKSILARPTTDFKCIFIIFWGEGTLYLQGLGHPT